MLPLCNHYYYPQVDYMWSWCHRISIPAMCWCYRATSNVLSVFQQVRPKLNPIQKGHGPYLVENKVAETGES